MTMNVLNYFGRHQTNLGYCNLIVLFVLIVGWQPALAGTPVPITSSPFNGSQVAISDAIQVVCPRLVAGGGVTSPDDQLRNLTLRCREVVQANTAANPGVDIADTTSSEVQNSIGIIAAGQTNSPGTQANRVGAGFIGSAGAAIGDRMNAIQAGLGGSQFAGFQLYQNGQLISDSDSVGADTGGAAGDQDMLSKLGLWAHGKYNFGSVERTFDEIGFSFDTWGMTAGADYRFTDNAFAGAAFTYMSTDSNFSRSGGGLDSDAYIGSIYGSFYVTDNFYINGIASYGEAEHDITRNISYTLPTAPQPVNTRTKGSPDGKHYSVGLSTGYDINMDATVVTPFARVNFSEGEIDSYSETETGPVTGWAQRYSEQRFRSLTTALGADASHALSTPFGVVTAQVHGEWVHEYKDSRRRYSTSFVGDPLAANFNIFSGNPDRNYFIAGIGFTGVFVHGISAYVNYEALLDYNNVDNHSITLGGRFEF